MVIKGNVTVGGYIQGTGMSIGTNDDSSTSNKSIYFGGSKSDNAYELTVIENRVYEAEEKAELLIFKGNDNADASGGGTYGPDRIRLKGGQIVFDMNAGYDRTAEDIRAVMHRNAGGAGMLGINVTSPTEVIHVDGKIKATQGFIGRGTELTGLNFNYINNVNDLKFSQAGATQSSTTWGVITLGSSIVYPTLALNSNSVSGYTVTASTDSVNAWKAFNDSTGSSNSWQVGDANLYSNGANRGGYLGSVERIAGYKGEWIEIQLPNPIYVERLDINTDVALNQARILYMFGSNDGVTYDLIQGSGDLGYLWSSSGNNTIFTRTPDVINEDPYIKILIIVNMISGGNSQYWANVDIYGKIGTFNPNMKLDYTGNVGIGTPTPAHPLDVVGNINCTGTLSKGSGSFRIDHPLANMSNTHNLYHSFIEGPQADLIYRGKVDLENGSASINLDTVSKMTSGTFEALNRNVQCFTSNESDWDAVKGSVSGNILTISCQNTSSTATVSWLVIGERKDQHMYDTNWTDDDGFVIPEQLK